MWCFVIEPNGTIHELILPQESCGFDCLDMIAARINLVEKDYFGLRHVSPSGKEKWLNLRNKLSDQLSGRSPHRVRLEVKFFVKVQELQQPVTRDLYYASIIQQIMSKKIDINRINDEDYTKLVALKAHIQYGGFNSESIPDYSTLLPSARKWTQTLQEKVETEHFNFDFSSASDGKIEFIKVVSAFSDYGIENYNVSSICENDNPDDMTLCVCQDGLRVYRRQDTQNSSCFDELRNLLNFIPYDEISTVSYKGKRFTIIHGNDKSNHSHSSFILKKNHEAIKLFRTFTEFHSFFQCNSVKKSVIEKCNRSSLGRLISIFNANSEKGKNYLFDVLRTRREAYDRAWSILNAPDKKRQSAFYHSDRHFNHKSVYSLSKIEESAVENYPSGKSKIGSIEFDSLDNNKFSDVSVEELEETVDNPLDDKVCQVCMDAEVSVAFCPCGHIVCCNDCANLCRECPLCRTQITYAQRVFFCSNC